MYQGETAVGFAAVIERGGKTALVSSYVLSDCRKRGIYGELLDARLSDVTVWPVTTTATEASRLALAARGFVATGQRGRYTLM
jgi:hypothetical protein